MTLADLADELADEQRRLEWLLDTFADAHLVRPTSHGYRMHDLVRAWARDR